MTATIYLNERPSFGTMRVTGAAFERPPVWPTPLRKASTMTDTTAPRGKAAPAYGTGRSESLRTGYVRIWFPGHPLAGRDGYVLEHRLVWFEHHGDIPAGHEVHHKDHDRSNNDIGNLELLTEAEHQAEHNQPGTLRQNQYGTWVVGEGKGAEWKRRREALGDRSCERCAEPINRLRLDARFCGSRCQVAAFKAKRRAS